MIVFLIFFICLNLIITYNIFYGLRKRKHLGPIIFRVKLDYISHLIILGTVLGAVFIISIVIYKLRQLNASELYNSFDKALFIINEAVYFLVLVKIFINVIFSREIREKGITMVRGAIDYSDIRRLEWLSDNKIIIRFAGRIFTRPLEEKWNVTDNQTARLKDLLKEKYYDVF